MRADGATTVANTLTVTTGGAAITGNSTVTGTLTVTAASSLTLGTSSSAAGAIIFKNASNANTLTIQSGVTSASYSLTLPTAAGSAGNVLTTDGAGVLSFAPAKSSAATFNDTTPAAFADNDTTELFDDATKPNITTTSTTDLVLVSVHAYGLASNTTADAFLAARIVFAVGSDPSCSTSTQVGLPMIGGFTTTTTHPWQVSGSFLHTPGSAGNVRYTVCTSAAATGTATDTAEAVTVNLVLLGP
ncbi:MAG: hypothetical protein HYU87_09465 [Chloroflexi bacterium]|nr:hypothetical protein [Chloroflexota bacterium]